MGISVGVNMEMKYTGAGIPWQVGSLANSLLLILSALPLSLELKSFDSFSLILWMGRGKDSHRMFGGVLKGHQILRSTENVFSGSSQMYP